MAVAPDFSATGFFEDSGAPVEAPVAAYGVLFNYINKTLTYSPQKTYVPITATTSTYAPTTTTTYAPQIGITYPQYALQIQSPLGQISQTERQNQQPNITTTQQPNVPTTVSQYPNVSPTSQPSISSGVPSWMIIAGIAVVALAAVYFLFGGKKKK